MIFNSFKKPSMLARFWLWLGRLLGKTLLFLLVIGLISWALATAWLSPTAHREAETAKAHRG